MTRLPPARDASAAGPVARGLSFLVAVALGVALGWRLFLAPEREIAASPTVTAAPGVQVGATVVPVRGAPDVIIPPAGGLSRGSSAPDFTLRDLSGQQVALSDYAGWVVLINFWTTWCPPCRQEMPALESAYQDHREQGFVVLGVNWTQVDDEDRVAPFVAEMGITFPILLDEQGVVSENQYRVLGLPTSVFVGREGKVEKITIGALQIEGLDAMLETMLEENS